MIGLVYPNRALCNIIYSTDRKKLYSQKHSGLYSSEIRRFMLDQKLSCEMLQICHTFGNEKPTYSFQYSTKINHKTHICEELIKSNYLISYMIRAFQFKKVVQSRVKMVCSKELDYGYFYFLSPIFGALKVKVYFFPIRLIYSHSNGSIFLGKDN